MSDLLEKVKAIRGKVTEGEGHPKPWDPDTAIAWLFNEVSYSQVVYAINEGKRGAAYHWLALSLRKAAAEGKIVRRVDGGQAQ
jgi:hypothetical protein